MLYEEEKDYIMRIIKEMIRVLISVLLGKRYVQVELPLENKYGISEANASKWKTLVDSGKVNEAENMLLENIDYNSKENIAEALFFYEYVSEKGKEFLEACDYSEDEVLDGVKRLAVHSGCRVENLVAFL